MAMIPLPCLGFCELIFSQVVNSVKHFFCNPKDFSFLLCTSFNFLLLASSYFMFFASHYIFYDLGVYFLLSHLDNHTLEKGHSVYENMKNVNDITSEMSER